MSNSPPLTVILHSGSGHNDAAEAQAQIRAGLEASGRAHRVLIANSPDEVREHALSAVEQSRSAPQVIVAAGGDGTLNLVADIVLGSGLAFGVIPLGTFNFFARNLGIPLEPRAAAEALATSTIRRVHVARVNGHLFLNNASFGLYRELLEKREDFKQKLGRYKVVAVMAALATLWRHRRVYTLNMELDGKPVRLRTPMLFFGLNPLQLEKLDLDIARCAQAGLLAVIALRPTSRWHILGLALRGALQGLHNSPELRCHGARHVEVSLAGRRGTLVAVDGETVDCELPLEFEVLREALPVLVPRHPEERH